MRKTPSADQATENEDEESRQGSPGAVGADDVGANVTDKGDADMAGGDTVAATNCADSDAKTYVDSDGPPHPLHCSESTATESTGWETVSAVSATSLTSPNPSKSPPAVCRICHVGQEKETEEPVLNSLCNCRGNLGALHASCLRRWVNIRGQRECEICKSPFLLPHLGPPSPTQDSTTSGSTAPGSPRERMGRGWVRMRRFATFLGLGGLATFVLVLLVRLDLFHRKAAISGQGCVVRLAEVILDDKALFGTREKLVIFSSLSMILLVLYSLSWICEEMAHAAGRAAFHHVHHHHHQQAWLQLLPLARREVTPAVV